MRGLYSLLGGFVLLWDPVGLLIQDGLTRELVTYGVLEIIQVGEDLCDLEGGGFC